MKFNLHNLLLADPDGKDWKEDRTELPRTVYLEFLPWGDDLWPRPPVIAKYQLVEVFEGEVKREEAGDTRAKRVVSAANRAAGLD